MKAKLYREANGNFGLCRNQPVRARIEGTRVETYYVPPGDPVGFRHMCGNAVVALLGGIDPQIEPMDQPLDVEAFIVPAEQMTVELRKLIEASQNGAKEVRQMAYKIIVTAQAIDEATNQVVPGHDFRLEIPGQSEAAVEEFAGDLEKFGQQERKKARHAK